MFKLQTRKSLIKISLEDIDLYNLWSYLRTMEQIQLARAARRTTRIKAKDNKYACARPLIDNQWPNKIVKHWIKKYLGCHDPIHSKNGTMIYGDLHNVDFAIIVNSLSELGAIESSYMTIKIN